MSRYAISAALAAVGLMASGTASGQDLADYCRDLYAQPKVGEYAELRLTDPASDRTGQIRFAVIDTESADGRTLFWFEVLTTGGPVAAGESVIAQVLVERYPFDSDDIRGYILKFPGRPAMRVPDEMVGEISRLGSGQIGWEEACSGARDLGTERVEVAAGTFRARHLETGDEQPDDLWLSPDIPFGIVKFSDPEGGTMELVRHGTGARSSITEEPVDFQMPGRRPPDGP